MLIAWPILSSLYLLIFLLLTIFILKFYIFERRDFVVGRLTVCELDSSKEILCSIDSDAATSATEATAGSTSIESDAVP